MEESEERRRRERYVQRLAVETTWRCQKNPNKEMNSEDLPAITNDFLFHHLQEIVCYRWEVLISLSMSSSLPISHFVVSLSRPSGKR